MFTLPAGIGIIKPSSAGVTSIISSIQQVSITIGTTATSNTATITSVDTTRAVLIYGGMRGTETSAGPAYNQTLTRATLTNATTVTATRNTTSATFTTTINVTVVEFTDAAIDSVEYGSITISAASSSNTATISSVTTARSAVLYLGHTTTAGTGITTSNMPRLTFTNATTITANRSATTGDVTVNFVVVQFASGITNSIQEASISITNTNSTANATISAVTTAKTLVVYGGYTNGSGGGGNGPMPYVYLANTTTLTAVRTGTSQTTAVNVTAIEFASSYVSSKQSGQTAIADASATKDNTVTAVATAKSVTSFLGQKIDSSDEPDATLATLSLTSTTNVRQQRGAANAGGYVYVGSWELMEFV